MKASLSDLAYGVRVAASVCLALFVAFALELDNAFWAAASAAVVCQPNLGASLRKAWFRLVGTLIGAVMIVAIAAAFTQNRAGFLAALALWGAACALASTLLRNFAAYAAALAGYTAAIVARDALGDLGGGPDNEVFILALWRGSEICTGIVCAGVVFALTDLGGARRRLANLVNALIARIGTEFATNLTTLQGSVGIRRELIRDVIALDPAIDAAIGESAELRYQAPRLTRMANGFFGALAAWRAVDNHLPRVGADNNTRPEVAAILQALPSGGGPATLRLGYSSAARRLLSSRARSPAGQLLIDQTARTLFGLSGALSGLALLAGDPARQPSPAKAQRVYVADWGPSLLNALRALLAIGAAATLWIVTSWSEGALCMTWTAITVILFGPRGDTAYAAALTFFLGTALAAVLAALVKFALLPQVHSFPALALVLSCYIIPVSALGARWPQSALLMAMAANFVPLVAPANLANYDTVDFYNSALALCAGCALGVLSFQLLPPLSPAARTQRLLHSTLHDLRRIAADPPPYPEQWQERIYARLAACPDSAEPLQRARIVAALSAGTEIIRLNHLAQRLGLSRSPSPALTAFAQGRSGLAGTHLAQLDVLLAAMPCKGRGRLVSHMRASALALSEVLIQHSTYFDAAPHEPL